MSGSVLDTGNKTVNKTDKPCSHVGYIPIGETDSDIIWYYYIT